jgi:hypothetical protein
MRIGWGLTEALVKVCALKGLEAISRRLGRYNCSLPFLPFITGRVSFLRTPRVAGNRRPMPITILHEAKYGALDLAITGHSLDAPEA